MTGDWIDDNMPDWLKQALYGRPWSIGWGEKQDAVYQSEQRQQEACNQQLVKKPFTREGYVSADLEEVDCNGFSGANVIITNKKNGEFRALMLIQRQVDRLNGGYKLILSCTGGQRNSMEEDAWTCACREAREETGGLAWFATTPPAHVAWLGQSKKSPAHKDRRVHTHCPRRAVFMYETSDDMLAERIQNLSRPPEGENGLLPPFGAPLTAVWVPLALLRDKEFRRLYLPQWVDDDRIWTDLATVHLDLTTMHIDLEPLESVGEVCVSPTHEDDASVCSSNDTEPPSERETKMGQVSKWGVEQVLRFFEDCKFPTEGVEAGQVDGSTLLALSQESDAEELFTSPVPNGMGFNRLLFIGRFRKEMTRFTACDPTKR